MTDSASEFHNIHNGICTGAGWVFQKSEVSFFTPHPSELFHLLRKEIV